MKNDRWVFHSSAAAQPAGEGVTRRVLAYCQDLMCVENTFEKGACGALHHHPHTQITYVVSGRFEFEIDGEKRVVTAGDTMLKMNGVTHGCVCLEAGVLLDIFTPMREDFVPPVSSCAFFKSLHPHARGFRAGVTEDKFPAQSAEKNIRSLSKARG